MECQAYNQAQVVSGCGVGVGKFTQPCRIIARMAHTALERAGVYVGVGRGLTYDAKRDTVSTP
jgi:hypothetical protein